MYNTHLEFHSQNDDRPVCFSPAECYSRPQCGTIEQWSVYLIALTHPVRARLPFGEIWSCRWAGGDHCSDRRCDDRRQPSPRWSPRVPKLTATVLLAVSVTVYQMASIQHPSLVTSDRDWRHYRGQKCRSVGKLLHFPIWNVSWLNSWQSNPMYNTHPKYYSEILGK